MWGSYSSGGRTGHPVMEGHLLESLDHLIACLSNLKQDSEQLDTEQLASCMAAPVISV